MIPSDTELLEYIRKNDLANYSSIAKRFKIKNATVTDLIDHLLSKQLVDVKKIGGSKIVRLKKRD